MRPQLVTITKKTAMRSLFIFALVSFFTLNGSSQGDSACTGYPNIGQKKVIGISIGGSPGTPRYVSLLQYTPKQYNPSDFTTLYPVLIYFPGNATAAANPPGTIDPCRMIYDQTSSLPGKIAENKFRDSVFAAGKWNHFIVLSFQYNTYNYPSDFPSPASVDSVIDYVLATYRADPARVYLTGMSAGANIVVEYGGSSVTRAQRVAAISISSTCSQVGVFPNSSNAGANIAAGRLATRFISCTSDGSCPHAGTLGWVNAINSSNPNPPSELIALNGPTGPLACEGFAHNSWNKLYDSAFRFNGTNLLEWNFQFSRNSVVPVLLQAYTARLSNGKVFLNWSTSREISASSFTIEKAGIDQRFTELVSIKANGNSSSVNNYSYVDEKPLPGLNYYRLVQMDADNSKHYFETRKIMHARTNKTAVIILPNPVSEELTAFITISRAQRVSITITDMNGRVLKNKTAFYGEGNTGVTIQTTSLPGGVYFLKTTGEDFSDVQKIVKK